MKKSAAALVLILIPLLILLGYFSIRKSTVSSPKDSPAADIPKTNGDETLRTKLQGSFDPPAQNSQPTESSEKTLTESEPDIQKSFTRERWKRLDDQIEKQLHDEGYSQYEIDGIKKHIKDNTDESKNSLNLIGAVNAIAKSSNLTEDARLNLQSLLLKVIAGTLNQIPQDIYEKCFHYRLRSLGDCEKNYGDEILSLLAAEYPAGIIPAASLSDELEAKIKDIRSKSQTECKLTQESAEALYSLTLGGC